MSLDFDKAITYRAESDLVESSTIRGLTGEKSIASFPSSEKARGLAITSLQVTSAWDALYKLLGKKHQIYFLTIAFDLSGEDFVILPPAEVPASAVYKVKAGETLTFTLGDGVPLFYPRVIMGGLIAYIIVVEADNKQKIGKVMKEVHKDLKEDGSLVDKVKQLITNPSATIVDEVLTIATAAMQPIATILENNGDDYIALFSGVYSATDESWEGKLTQSQNGATIVLKEL